MGRQQGVSRPGPQRPAHQPSPPFKGKGLRAWPGLSPAVAPAWAPCRKARRDLTCAVGSESADGSCERVADEAMGTFRSGMNWKGPASYPSRPAPCWARVALPARARESSRKGTCKLHGHPVPQAGTRPSPGPLSPLRLWSSGVSGLRVTWKVGPCSQQGRASTGLPGGQAGALPPAAGTGGSPSQPVRHRWTPGSSSPPHRRPGGKRQGGVSEQRPVQNSLSPDTQVPPVNSDKFCINYRQRVMRASPGPLHGCGSSRATADRDVSPMGLVPSKVAPQSPGRQEAARMLRARRGTRSPGMNPTAATRRPPGGLHLVHAGGQCYCEGDGDTPPWAPSTWLRVGLDHCHLASLPHPAGPSTQGTLPSLRGRRS